MRDPFRALGADALEVGHQPPCDRGLEICRLAPVKADGDGAGFRRSIGPAVDRDRRSDRHGARLSVGQPLSGACRR